MLNGLHHDAGRAVAGLAGAFVLSTGAATVLLVAEAVRRVAAEAYERAIGFDPKTSVKDSKAAFMFPCSECGNTNKLASMAAMSFFASLAGMFVLNKFCPSFVTNANKLVGFVAPLQFTADIPILNLIKRFYR